MGVIEPRPNPETVEALLDTTWRTAAAEAGRTDALDRKASAAATFTSLVATLTATLGLRFVAQFQAEWALALFLSGLAALVSSVCLAVAALLPTEFFGLDGAYLRSLPKWSELRKSPEQVRGATMRGVVEAILLERETNEAKARAVRWSFVLLLLGLVLIAGEAATLAIRDVRR